jgi:hypothetical protein
MKIEYEIIQAIIIIYFIIATIPVIYGIKGSCHSCLYKRYKFPNKNWCAVYDTLNDIALKNCTKYEIDFKAIKTGL